MITHYALLPARPHDIQSIDILLEEFEGAAPADKGFIDEHRQSLLLERHGILVVTPPRKNMKTTLLNLSSNSADALGSALKPLARI
ncbi:MAG: hypothetical protein ACTFAK_04915 [Candidatus Electronema sp. VV]